MASDAVRELIEAVHNWVSYTIPTCKLDADLHDAYVKWCVVRDNPPLAALDAAEVPTKPEVAGWQPIETAPRDGTEIDVLTKMGGRIVEVWWDEEREHWRHIGISEVGEEEATPLRYQPTHWMPLPEPPAALDRAREGGE